ncbi:spore coat protein CotJB [Herbivorax sp. ANBcel31]|uniref:spore coat protein CotJB n=1 Tax=Herbivorax sp. ANBcel31 TaxID=3069754 RepID=UPI0027B2F67E|nr:spore coat protein CotJB [Herbivorax sp. ANBcel31]MDQ2087680.1 spore coat protein CotJB [Herbivorax sp. ANBcel31]
MHNRQELLKQLTALDFMAVDLQLFLDTHPCDREALCKYNSVVSQAAMLRHTFERLYGPLCSYRSSSQYPWQWICDPWPWNYSFNFSLAGEER